MTNHELNRRLIVVLDVLALAALFLTRELPPWSLKACVSILLFRLFFRRLRLPQAGIIALLIGIVCFGVFLGIKFSFPWIIAAASVVPLAHATLWFSSRERELTPWRLGLGFSELLIASVLTPEFYLPLLVAFFLSGSALLLNGLFLAEQTVRTPPGWLKRSLLQSATILAIAALIFPILPRVDSTGFSGRSNPSRVDYTEEVSLQRGTSPSAGNTRTVMRFYFSNENVPSFQGNLIKGKSLDRIEGGRWGALPRTPKPIPSSIPLQLNRDSTSAFEVIREKIDSDSLPMPYGSWIPAAQTDSQRSAFPRWIAWNDWSDPSSRYRSVVYRAQESTASGAMDPVRPEHLKIPPEYATPPWNDLTLQLGARRENPRETITQIQRYLLSPLFSATDPDGSGPEGSNEAAPSGNPLNEFLFKSRRGHCELFASSAALLLRHQGIPARLVAGFRVSRSSQSGILTVRAEDAHAWVEAYVDNRWIPLDPTPRIARPLSFGRDLRDWFLDRFELAEGLWYRSVVNYDWNESVKSSLGLVRERLPSVVAGQLRHAISDRWDSFFGKGTALLAWATGIAACIALLLWVRRYYLNWKITRSPKDFDQVRRAALLRELKRMQKQMARAQNSVSKCPTKNLLDPQRSQNWNLFQKVYVQFRFGPEIQSLAQLRKAVLELERIRIAFVQEQRRG